MPGSNSYAFEVTLSWTTMHMGAADWATLHSHSAIRTKPYFARSTVPPIRRDLELCGGVMVLQNLRGRELAQDSCSRLKCATSSARSIWLTYDKVASRSTLYHRSLPKTRSSISAVTGFTISLRRM